MNKTEAAIKYEHYETALWAARAILEKESVTPGILDPCTGTGILSEAVKNKYLFYQRSVITMDICDWGYPLTMHGNYLKSTLKLKGHTVFMNPPFSKACEFVEHSLRLGAEKVICFQRMAWYESIERAYWFNFFPPDRIWLCGNRATCWRHDISPADRLRDPKTGKKRTGSTTPHAWFIFEAGSKSTGTVIDKIWKLKGEKS